MRCAHTHCTLLKLHPAWQFAHDIVFVCTDVPNWTVQRPVLLCPKFTRVHCGLLLCCVHGCRIGARTGPQQTDQSSLVDSRYVGDIGALAFYNYGVLLKDLPRLGVFDWAAGTAG